MDSKETKYPIFNGTGYSLWKNKMMHFIKDTDYKYWRIILKGPLTITTVDVLDNTSVKEEDDYDANDFAKAQNNSRAMSFLQHGITKEESRFSSYTSTKQIWDSLELAYEGPSGVKKYRIDLLNQLYEMFHMKRDENNNHMSARFSNITNELRNRGKLFETKDLVRNFLRSLTKKWQPKVTAIEEAKEVYLDR
ncbi:uncharacterized protein LOC141631259 [Silene latifolia]|uniref:uncharacterized protein LOC141631259 n=1 Tax=Silene latifolia TaxID=37657 RepID=UPI003D77978E